VEIGESRDRYGQDFASHGLGGAVHRDPSVGSGEHQSQLRFLIGHCMVRRAHRGVHMKGVLLSCGTKIRPSPA